MTNSHSSETINFTQQGSIATITLNNPSARNKLSMKDIDFLLNVFDQVNKDMSVRALVLTGTGSTFCSGFDLQELAQLKADESPEVNEVPRPLFERLTDELEHLRCPTICALNGGVYGGAIDLALACDFRVGKPDLELVMPASRIGLHYYPNGIRRYVSRLGVAASKKLFLLGERISGNDLEVTGFTDFLTSNEEFESTIARLSKQLASAAPLAIEGMKNSINYYAKHVEADEKLLQGYWAALTSSDFRTGLTMALKKQPAQFERK